MSYHNLGTSNIPPCAHLLLGLGLKFCLERRVPQNNLRKTFSRYCRNVRITAWLEEQKQNGNDMIDSKYVKKLYVKSDWDPPYARADIKMN